MKLILDLKKRLRLGLIEDGAFHDITTCCLPGHASSRTSAYLYAKEKGIFCGAFLILPIFQMLDPQTKVKLYKKDAQPVKKGDLIARIRASVRALMAGERLFLNLACQLSGIATLTRRYVEAVRGTKTIIMDTRKTTPLWRDLEKYAVVCGGGVNHRMSLKDGLMAKDNHLTYLRRHGISVAEVFGKGRIGNIRKKPFLVMEAKSYRDVWDAIKARASVILLDNMSLEKIKGSMILIKTARKALRSPYPLIEVSGNVKIKRARILSKLGVDRISVGALTHSAPALDLSLLIQ